VAASGARPGNLTGVDHNREMLDVARRTAEGTVPEVRWVEADAGHLPFEDGQFDLVFCQQALQFFPDRAAALSEVRRVLKDGGRTVFCVQRELAVNPMLAAQAATLDKHVGPSAGDAVRAICGLPDAGTIAGSFESAGFRDVAVESVSLSLHHPDGRAFAAGAMGGMHTGDKLSSLDRSRVESAVDDFLAALGPHYDGAALNFPHVSNVITARS
jgi:ubiquinone/menaquinone biosynthesis C-methylase UbiE